MRSTLPQIIASRVIDNYFICLDIRISNILQ